MATYNITSAYNFVPLQSRVVLPDWQDRSSQDVPLQDGFCAEIDISITNDTPLLVGDSRAERLAGQSSIVNFSRHPDGRHVIPGSSLRGLIRNVVEIVSNSQLYRLDDRKLSVRDIDNKDRNLYGGHFTEMNTETSPMTVVPLTRSAWMRFRDGRWWFCHVPHVRVEQDDLKARLQLDLKGWWLASKKDRTPQGKYRHVQDVFRQRSPAGKPLQVFFSGAQAREDGTHLHRKNDKNGPLSIRYRKVRDIAFQSGADYLNGRLVVTGQPSESKHMEFIFQAPAATSWFELDDALVTDFLRINDTPETMLETFKGAGNPFGADIGFPVFYLCSERTKAKATTSDDIRAIGLSQMFRLPYPQSLGEAALSRQPEPGVGRLDLARTLFGAVEDEVPRGGAAEVLRGSSRRGRVSFGDCRLADALAAGGASLEAPAVFQTPTVLNGPKPSFYPNYIEQNTSAPAPAQAQRGNNYGRAPSPAPYTTLMDEGATLRGWKRYPVHSPQSVKNLPPPPEKSKPDVQTRLHPLRAGLRFTGRIRLHNVTRQELGAVLWALTWGGDDKLRHALGMGKPMGLGQVAIALDAVHIRPNDPAAAVPDVAACRSSFETWMRSQNSGWTASIKELLAMANPQALGTAHLTPLNLNAFKDGKGVNEFRKAKQDGAVLPAYTGSARSR